MCRENSLPKVFLLLLLPYLPHLYLYFHFHSHILNFMLLFADDFHAYFFSSILYSYSSSFALYSLLYMHFIFLAKIERKWRKGKFLPKQSKHTTYSNLFYWYFVFSTHSKFYFFFIDFPSNFIKYPFKIVSFTGKLFKYLQSKSSLVNCTATKSEKSENQINAFQKSINS